MCLPAYRHIHAYLVPGLLQHEETGRRDRQRPAERGYEADSLHGDMTQSRRDHAMLKFRKKLLRILVATDVAARGIDVDDIEAVINYDVPQDDQYYVHRIGRTARMGKGGHAFTLVLPGPALEAAGHTGKGQDKDNAADNARFKENKKQNTRNRPRARKCRAGALIDPSQK